MLASKFFQDPGRSGSRARELFEAFATRQAWEPRTKLCHRPKVVVDANQQGEGIAAEAAFRMLSGRLEILVENLLSDGAFLDAVIKAFGDDELYDLWRLSTEPITPHGCGGAGQVRPQIERLVTHRSRLFVLVDSDGLRPGEMSAEASQIVATCNHHDIPYHILSMREAENYLGSDALREWARDRGRLVAGRIDALDRLTPSQRDYYDMKKGFRGGDFERQRDLFAGLSAEDIECLRQGFGNSVSTAFAAVTRGARFFLRGKAELAEVAIAIGSCT